MIEAWYRKCAKEKEEKVVVKTYDNEGAFVKSIIIPTVMFPLNSSKFRTFHYENTELVLDNRILELIDTVPYKIGRCYLNTEKLYTVLIENGYKPKTYVGWLFIGEKQMPVHHCWLVINDNQVIDLADDFCSMFTEQNIESWKNISTSKTREKLLDFAKGNKNKKNSDRCYPIGKPFVNLYYVGSECEPNEGRIIYQNLIEQFPDHVCHRNVNNRSGLNATQEMLKENGLF